MKEEDAKKCKPVKRRLNNAESPFEVNPKKYAKMAASTEDEVTDHHVLDDTIEVVDDEAVQSPVMVPVLTRCTSTPQDGQTLQNYVSPPALLTDSGFESSVELSSGSLSDRSTSVQARVSFDFDGEKNNYERFHEFFI